MFGKLRRLLGRPRTKAVQKEQKTIPTPSEPQPKDPGYHGQMADVWDMRRDK